MTHLKPQLALCPMGWSGHLQYARPNQPNKRGGALALGAGLRTRAGRQGLEGLQSLAAGFSPPTSAPVTGWCLQGALFVARAGGLPTSSCSSRGWVLGRRAERRSTGPSRAPGAGFRICFYLAVAGRLESRVPSCPAGSSLRACPGGDVRESGTQRWGDPESGRHRLRETRSPHAGVPTCRARR